MFGAPIGKIPHKRNTPYAFRVGATTTKYQAQGYYHSLADAKQAQKLLNPIFVSGSRIDELESGRYLLSVAYKKKYKYEGADAA